MALGRRNGTIDDFYGDELVSDFDIMGDERPSPKRRRKNKRVSRARKRTHRPNRRRKHRQSSRKKTTRKSKRKGMSKEFLRKLRQKHGLGEYKR